MPTTVTIDPTADASSIEYVVELAPDTVPTDLGASQTWYPDARLVAGYTTYWTATVEVDGAVAAVHADGATVTIDQPEPEATGYGIGGFGERAYGT